MENTVKINSDVTYIGASDRRISLFENQYPVPAGISYNSYLVTDDETTLLDTCDWAVGQIFFDNLETALAGRDLNHIIINHMEPDHCATLATILNKYPNAKIRGTAKVAGLISQFHGIDVTDRFTAVKDGDELNTGKHIFKFFAAPMVHWPEVMVTYDATDKILYSADAFGRFGALSGNITTDGTDVWETDVSESRRYYANIVGKYGMNTANALKKIKTLEIDTIAPLHGPVITKGIEECVDLYDKWSTYTPESDEVVIFCASIYGGTENACDILASKLAAKGKKNIRIYDVSSTNVSYLISEAFRCKNLVFASASQDAGLFAPMENFISDLLTKNLSNRRIAIIENGSWAPSAGKVMRAKLEMLKNVEILEPAVTVKSALSKDIAEQLEQLADSING